MLPILLVRVHASGLEGNGDFLVAAGGKDEEPEAGSLHGGPLF